MKIGDLRHRITFQKPVKTPDGYKGHTIKWQDFITVWASVEPLSGREYFYAHQIKNAVSHRIRIRYREDLNVEMRVKYGSRFFAVESIIDIKERREFMEVLCNEEIGVDG